jgi:type I restriction enzyme M protein
VIKTAIETNAGVQSKEAAIRTAFEDWWLEHSPRITELAAGQKFVDLRNDLLSSFSENLEQIGLLTPFQVRGIIAGFWNQAKYDFLTLMARGSQGVVDAWRTSIVTAMEDKANKDNPLEHKLVKMLLGSFVSEIEGLDDKKAELEGQISAATPKKGEDGEDEVADEYNPVDEAQLKAWKKELKKVKADLKAKRDSLSDELNKDVDGLSGEDAAELFLSILHQDVETIIERYLTQQRQAVIAAFECWWDKYRVTLTEIEADRDKATVALKGYLGGLGYV